MASILLKGVLHEGAAHDILIVDNKFAKLEFAGNSEFEADEVLDCSGLAILPPFYNAHTHAAMTLLRGYADDLPLQKWLSDFIWPIENKMQPEDVYAGSRLAILEMIRSGTVFFSDMYWYREETMRAAEEMGIRAAIGVTFAENLPHAPFEEYFQFLHERKLCTELLGLTVSPHAIYTVGPELLEKCAAFARAERLPLHIHLSETRQEVEACLAKTGKLPVEYLASLGAVCENSVFAHCVHMERRELEILSEAGATVVHNPAANLKLSSGLFDMKAMLEAGVKVALGTDGASSNNNLDMHESMKLASLLAKRDDPEVLPAKEALKMATRNGALAYGLDAGEIAVGKLADALLLDLSNERLVPGYNLVSNWVYSADSRALHSVICNGRFLMKNRVVPNEAEIVQAAHEAAARLVKR